MSALIFGSSGADLPTLIWFAGQMAGGRSSLESLGLRLDETIEVAVQGNCMRALSDGESVRVCRQRLYVPGDVVVVRRRGYWDVHRFLGYVLSAQGVAALTQADDAAVRDPAALARAIVGRADCRVTASDRIAALVNYARALSRWVAEVAQ